MNSDHKALSTTRSMDEKQLRKGIEVVFVQTNNQFVRIVTRHGPQGFKATDSFPGRKRF